LKLKIDENLPAECAEILVQGGFQAETVADEGMTGADDSALADASRSEGRIMVTLDLDFANIRAYPPTDYAGIIVLRPKRQDKHSVLELVHRFALVLVNRPPAGELWIVEPDSISNWIAGSRYQALVPAWQSSLRGEATTRSTGSLPDCRRSTRSGRKTLRRKPHLERAFQ